MKREIKFRAWDNVDYMSSHFTIDDVQNKKIQFTGDCPIMQYTGLKDKKGNEIYEGDILRAEGSKYTYQVKYVHGQFTARVIEYDLRNTAFYLYTFLQEHKPEIVGNIYEHPHLIAGSNAV